MRAHLPVCDRLIGQSVAVDKVERQGQAEGSLVSQFMDRPVLSALSFVALQATILWLFFGRPSSPQAIALIVGLSLALIVGLALASRRRSGARPYADRRQEGWELTQRWSQRHPLVGRLCLWWVGAMVVGQVAFSIAYAIHAEWLAAAYYGAAAVGFTWLGWSWMHTLRGTPSPPRLRLPGRE
jgi:hypothetical protein